MKGEGGDPVAKRATYEPLAAEVVLKAYRAGYFPMADPSTLAVSWYSPDPRAIIPLRDFRATRSLRQKIRKGVFEIRINTAFEDVIRACADRAETWLSEEIIAVYTELHGGGYAHSVESWHGGTLAGGLYGVAIGGAFFGESMFSRMADASKAALVDLVTRLKQRGFLLLDTQYVTKHLEQFGVLEIPRSRYLSLLARALGVRTSFLDSTESSPG